MAIKTKQRVNPGSRRAAIYARVSTDGQTVENQLRELREAVRRHGWHVAVTLTDKGVSGAKGRDQRPGFDRAMIQERVRAGLARARSKGTRLGRPRKVTPRLASKIKEAHAQGTPMRQIARDVGVSPASVHAAVHGNAGTAK